MSVGQSTGGSSPNRGNEVFLTAQEVAAWLKIKLPTVRKWQRQGLPCLKAGRLCRYEKEQVRSWLEERAARGAGK